MNIDIRKYIINNFKGNNKKEIEQAVNDSISSKQEEILPGLGVLFELVWDSKLKNNIIDELENKVN